MKLEIYDLGDRRTVVRPTYTRLELPDELQAFCDRRWTECRQGWANSWIPNLESVTISEKQVQLDVGVTDYRQQIGMVEAFQEGQPFATPQINGVAVGVYAVTSDHRIVLPRRSAKVAHAPLYYHTFSGWISTMRFAPREKCEDAALIQDWQLYSLAIQVAREFEEETRLRHGEYEIHGPLFITRAAPHSLNVELEFLGSVNCTAAELIERMQGLAEFAPGRKEADHAVAIPLEDLTALLEHQAALVGKDPSTHAPNDHRDVILLDRTIAGFVHLYLPLIGQQLPDTLMENLKQAGIVISEETLADGIHKLKPS